MWSLVFRVADVLVSIVLPLKTVLASLISGCDLAAKELWKGLKILPGFMLIVHPCLVRFLKGIGMVIDYVKKERDRREREQARLRNGGTYEKMTLVEYDHVGVSFAHPLSFSDVASSLPNNTNNINTTNRRVKKRSWRPRKGSEA